MQLLKKLATLDVAVTNTKELNMKKVLSYIIATGLLTLGAFMALSNALDIPDVYFSYDTGKCVKVVNYTDENFTCDNYPEKFNHGWVMQ